VILEIPHINDLWIYETVMVLELRKLLGKYFGIWNEKLPSLLTLPTYRILKVIYLDFAILEKSLGCWISDCTVLFDLDVVVWH
jgi:hypothetical protein